MTKVITFWFMVSISSIIVLYDIAIAIESTPGDTISKVAQALFLSHPALAFVVGGMIGHFSSTLRDYFPSWWLWVSLPLLILIVGVLIFFDVKGWLPKWPAIWYICIGMLVVHILWPQFSR